LELVPASDYWDLIAKSRQSPILALIYRIPPRFWRELSKVQEELKALDARQLYGKPSTFHITVKAMRILDEKLDDHTLDSLLAETQELVSEFPAFEIRLKGLGIFPTAIYVKAEDKLDQLRMMNKRIIAEFGDTIENGSFDGDAFVPHVTIATFNSKEAAELVSKVKSREMQQMDFGTAEVFELEAVEARMYLLLGPEDTQDSGFKYLRSMHLSGVRV
jgi:2'-5' RNA ligase